MKWQVTYYKRENSPAITKVYANMNSASLAVEKLRKRGIGAEMSPVMQPRARSCYGVKLPA